MGHDPLRHSSSRDGVGRPYRTLARSSTTSALGRAARLAGGTRSLRSRLPPPTITRSTAMIRLSIQSGRSVGQAVRGDATDLHAGDLDRLVARRERRLLDAEPAADRPVHVEPCGGEHQAGGVHAWLGLADHHDRVRRLVEPVAVRRAELGGVGEGRVAGHHLDTGGPWPRQRRSRGRGASPGEARAKSAMNAASRCGAAILEGMADATSTDARPRRPDPQLSAVPYLPGLDGLRALAVVAVMIYHANAEWLAGGFLGVEVFFVISGYLITLLLMAEREQYGRIDLRAFWGRRARRLLPALYLMLFLLLTYTMLFRRRASSGKLRGDLVGGAALRVELVPDLGRPGVHVGQRLRAAPPPLEPRGRGAVLHRVAGGDGAAAAARRHAAPGAHGALAGDRRAGGHGARGAAVPPGPRRRAASSTPEAYWQVGGRCIDKTDALYLSTLTRSSGLLLGAAFAMVWRPRAIMRGPLRNRGRVLDLARARRRRDPRRADVVRPRHHPRGRRRLAVPRRLPHHRDRDVAHDRRRHAPVHAHQPPVRDAAAAVGGHPVVRALPVPLADLPDHPQGRGQPAHARRSSSRRCSSPASSPRSRTR